MNSAIVEYVEHAAMLHHSALIIERNSLTKLIRLAASKEAKRPLQLRRRIVEALLNRNTRGLR